MNPELIIDPRLSPCPTLPALIWASGIQPPVRAGAPPAFLTEVLVRAKAPDFWPAGLKERVRGMLRHGRYKPSGRSKPASEFLLGAAREGSFPLVNGPADVNNAISLESGYPASIFDAGLTGRELLLRRGLPGEGYLFNPSGQVIDLTDLLLVCRRGGSGWEPCGNPVKDSMATKVQEGTRDLLAVLFAPAGEDPGRVESWAGRFAGQLGSHCRAQDVGYRVIGSSP